VIHNDIHGGNILLTDEGIMLIDFGRSRLIDESKRSEFTKIVASFGEAWADAFNSPWEIAGYEQSVRDDIYKAMESMAVWMIGTPLIDAMRRMQYRNTAVLYGWKMSDNIYSSAPGGNGIRLQIDSRVADRMGRLLSLVRSIERGNEVEIFEPLIRGLHSVFSFCDLNGL
jgi:hypothetical protein